MIVLLSILEKSRISVENRTDWKERKDFAQEALILTQEKLGDRAEIVLVGRVFARQHKWQATLDDIDILTGRVERHFQSA
jgi:hypothetical protein